ncbi:MAG TPA: 2OG-Fe(II) oxygenase [Roseiarcus sp.]|nr:2OG-Fe(II) oxygenase [Roseiarcus sp.]
MKAPAKPGVTAAGWNPHREDPRTPGVQDATAQSDRSNAISLTRLPFARDSSPGPVTKRIEALDWSSIERDLDAYGCAVTPKLLSPETCRELQALYLDDVRFRSRVVMGSHGFGRGEYKYFAYPLPEPIVELRLHFYSKLAALADRWNEAMGVLVRYPAEHEAFLARCHEAGQARPTPLLLRYGPGDYNCLHQDVYGAHLFPLQIAILLSEPGVDFDGGEFVLTEQRPRMQSRAEVVSLRQGDGVIFAVRERPVQGARGIYRVNLRHGVSRIKGGERFTLGVILHDAG